MAHSAVLFLGIILAIHRKPLPICPFFRFFLHSSQYHFAKGCSVSTWLSTKLRGKYERGILYRFSSVPSSTQHNPGETTLLDSCPQHRMQPSRHSSPGCNNNIVVPSHRRRPHRHPASNFPPHPHRQRQRQLQLQVADSLR